MKKMIDLSPKKFCVKLQNSHRKNIYSMVVKAVTSDIALIEAQRRIPDVIKNEVAFLTIVF